MYNSSAIEVGVFEIHSYLRLCGYIKLDSLRDSLT